MKTFVCGCVAIGLLGAVFHADAAADKVQITAQKQHREPAKVQVGGEGTQAKGTENVAYELKLQNQTFGDLSQLTVDYLIFVERPKLGSRLDQPSPVDRITGSKTVDVLTNRAPQTVVTDEFPLKKENLVGNYMYANGGRIKAEDTVVGVWVRVSQGGQVIGEYMNPPGVAKRGWDKK